MNKLRCLILFIIIFIVFLLNNYNLSCIENIGEVFYSKNYDFPKVYDILHENVWHIDKFEYASDIIALILIITLGLFKLLLYLLISSSIIRVGLF